MRSSARLLAVTSWKTLIANRTPPSSSNTGDARTIDQRQLPGCPDPVADGALGLDPLDREPSRKLGQRQRLAGLVEDLEARHDLRDRRGQELLCGRKADLTCGCVVRVQEAAVRILHRDPVGDLAQDHRELVARLAQLLLDPGTVVHRRDRAQAVPRPRARRLSPVHAQLSPAPGQVAVRGAVIVAPAAAPDEWASPVRTRPRACRQGKWAVKDSNLRPWD